MNDLKQVLSKLGFQNLNTYLQSGNLVFESELTSCAAIEKIVVDAILDGFGFDIKVKVIDKENFQRSFSNNPFTESPGVDIKQLYYIHLMGKADMDTFTALQNDQKYPEIMSLKGELIYVQYLNGYGRSKLHGNVFERKLKLSATARNHNTMKNLCQMLAVLE